MSEKGLYEKYIILDAETREEKEGAYFILKPAKDPAAIAAIKKYAEITTNKQLASDLLSWMEGLELVGVEQPPECDYCEETVDKVRSSPFLGDVESMMCKGCWDMTREEYLASNGEDIGDF